MYVTRSPNELLWSNLCQILFILYLVFVHVDFFYYYTMYVSLSKSQLWYWFVSSFSLAYMSLYYVDCTLAPVSALYQVIMSQRTTV